MNVPISELGLGQIFFMLVSLAVLAVACFYVMLFVFAQLTGWRAMAARYRDVGREPTPYRAGSSTLGVHAWSSPPLLVGVDDSGLTLRPALPFRPVFPSLHIPWGDIRRAECKQRMFFRVLELHCGPGADTIVGFLPSGAADAIEARLPIAIGEAT